MTNVCSTVVQLLLTVKKSMSNKWLSACSVKTNGKTWEAVLWLSNTSHHRTYCMQCQNKINK